MYRLLPVALLLAYLAALVAGTRELKQEGAAVVGRLNSTLSSSFRAAYLMSETWVCMRGTGTALNPVLPTLQLAVPLPLPLAQLQATCGRCWLRAQPATATTDTKQMSPTCVAHPACQKSPPCQCKPGAAPSRVCTAFTCSNQYSTLHTAGVPGAAAWRHQGGPRCGHDG
jgi:hypothetical protein